MGELKRAIGRRFGWRSRVRWDREIDNLNYWRWRALIEKYRRKGRKTVLKKLKERTWRNGMRDIPEHNEARR